MSSVLSNADVPIIGEGATEEPAAETAENPLARQLTYTFAAGEIDAVVGERLSQMSKKAKINGFRPGHVPMRVMRERWGGHCLGEILTEKANARFAQEAGGMNERPAASPQISPSAVADSGNYKVECYYEAMPEVAAPDFDKQEIHRPTLTVGLIREAVSSKCWRDLQHFYRDKALLRIEDTGGQPEFMDMLPALTIGPALYLLFCKLTDDLHSPYKVSYCDSSGKSTTPVKSTYTVEEVILSALASVVERVYWIFRFKVTKTKNER